MNVSDKSTNCALSMFMSEFPADIPVQDVINHLTECGESGAELGEGYIVWEPFELYPVNQLIEWISDAADFIETTFISGEAS